MVSIYMVLLVKSQLICFFPIHSRISLHWLKGLLQKNPLSAEKGEGCADLRIKCLSVSMRLAFCCANAPRRMKTMPSFLSERVLMTASVKICHPISLWEFGLFFLTVKLALRRRIPCLARFSKFQLRGGSMSRSAFSSLKIFLKEGGILIPSGTEKLSPWASPVPW